MSLSPLNPPPLSSGDHTVKISCCRTNLVLRSLAGHSRTPWVVRFHPRLPHLVASGSLDHQVRLWNAHTGECLAMFQFGKPIASLSFHISSPVIAVACGHRVSVDGFSVIFLGGGKEGGGSEGMGYTAWS